MIVHAVVDEHQYDGGHEFLKGYSEPNAQALALIELQRVRHEYSRGWEEHWNKFPNSHRFSLVPRLEALKIIELEIEMAP